MKGMHTENFSVWLYLVYVAVSAEQGLDSSCRPSTLKGDRESDRSAFMTTVPCWNCMMASGHDGSAAMYQSASSHSPSPLERTYDLKSLYNRPPHRTHLK
jgi:hypothetical protein